MTQTLILIKHSKPEIVDTIPAKEWSLSAIGRERAVRLAGQLTIFAPQTVVSSVEPKAEQTAQIIAETLIIPCYTHPDLHEHDRSNVLANDSQEQFEAKVQAFFAQPDQLVYGLETANEALRRFSHALDEAMAEYPVDSLALVAHGTVISLYLAALCGLEHFSLWKSLQLPAYAALRWPEKTLLNLTPSLP